jgi:glutaredoxin
MFELPARRFTEATGVLLAIATAVLGLGLERLARGSRRLGAGLILAGGLLTALAFSLRVEEDPGRETLLLVVRDECAHCDEARAILRDAQAELGFALWEVDVTEDERLRDRWLQEVPVLVRDGRVEATLEVRREDVDSALERA